MLRNGFGDHVEILPDPYGPNRLLSRGGPAIPILASIGRGFSARVRHDVADRRAPTTGVSRTALYSFMSTRGLSPLGGYTHRGRGRRMGQNLLGYA